MGETIADVFTNDIFGDEGKSLAMFMCLLAFFLAVQFGLQRYFPPGWLLLASRI